MNFVSTDFYFRDKYVYVSIFLLFILGICISEAKHPNPILEKTIPLRFPFNNFEYNHF